MPRYIAFLRAINVGGRVVKMERLRLAFEELGLAKVETFIASGNVIFGTRAKAPTIERKIAAHLEKTLGYEVTTFIRSDAELAEIAERKAFPTSEMEVPESTLFIGLLAGEPSKEAQTKLLAAPSKVDLFRFHGRELYWLCRTRASDSEFSGARLEKILGLRATVRNANTIQRLVAKYPASS
ncbi:MAG: DUF1697 domain-containing protein [Verrucomicrobiota bacterium]|nr:DUF1697 domain-containing protein [Verrucomicrobiota bacterium]